MAKEYSCVRRTKKAFESSLAELSKEYPLNRVTVKLLCEKAELSRNAFYFHYSDINDLVRDIEDNIIEEITKDLEDFRKLGFPDNILATIKALIDLFDVQRENVLMLFDKSYSLTFRRRLIRMFSDFNYSYFKEYNPNASKSSYELFYAFLSSGFYECLRLWLQNPDTISKEDVTRITYKMIKRLLMPDDPDIARIIGTSRK